MKLSFELEQRRRPALGVAARPSLLAGLLLATALAPTMLASENVPHRPFAMWADVPEEKQFVVGLVYEESESYHMWAAKKYYNVSVKANGENYGIDIIQGYLALQYGLTPRWALDLNVGFTDAAWRKFDPDENSQSTGGLMDMALGVRYQIYNELRETNYPWMPTLTFRAGLVYPGTYDQHFAFAPGLRSVAIEPELLLRKRFGWPGFGFYNDTLYRWNRTTGNNQLIFAAGFFQQIKGWELDAGYQLLETFSGGNIIYNPDDPSGIVYPVMIREIRNSVQAGFSYTTRKHHIRWGFHCNTVFSGNNTDRKFWVGGSVDIPIGGKREN